RPSVAARLREDGAEGANAYEKPAQAARVVRANGVVDDLRSDERVTIHVAPHPRVNAQRDAVELELLAVGALERPRELTGKDGEEIPQDLLDVPDNVLDLVADGGSLSPYLVGLPQDGDLLADLARRVFF